MSTCAKCGRSSSEWVDYSAQAGEEVCWSCLQEAVGGSDTSNPPG